MLTVKYRAEVGARAVEVSVLERDGNYEVTIDGVAQLVDVQALSTERYSVVVGGSSWAVDVAGEAPELLVHVGDQPVPVKLIDARRRLLAQTGGRAGPGAGPQAIRSSMPGKVVKVLCAVGDVVTAGQGLLVVEAMKMENEMRAPRDGTVAEVCVREGQPVDAGDALATLG